MIWILRVWNILGRLTFSLRKESSSIFVSGLLLDNFEESGANKISPRWGQISRSFIEIDQSGTRHSHVFAPDNLFEVPSWHGMPGIHFRVAGRSAANPSEYMFIVQQVKNNFDSQKHEFKMHYVFLQWRIVVNAKHIVSSKDSCIISASSLKVSFYFWTFFL